MRRLSERARLEGMVALRKALDGVKRPPLAALERAQVAYGSRSDTTATADVDLVEDALVEGKALSARSARDTEFLHGLERIADSIERVAAQLDSYHQERAEHLDAIEFLLREMVIGAIPAPANRPGVLGGVVENGEREISLVVDESALGVDSAVEVRSRFHDRWIGGFTIAETVNTPGRRRYRLTRRSDGIPLPILFDSCDVRAAEDAFSRQHSPS
jgi:hypothetical protein